MVHVVHEHPDGNGTYESHSLPEKNVIISYLFPVHKAKKLFVVFSRYSYFKIIDLKEGQQSIQTHYVKYQVHDTLECQYSVSDCSVLFDVVRTSFLWPSCDVVKDWNTVCSPVGAVECPRFKNARSLIFL